MFNRSLISSWLILIALSAATALVTVSEPTTGQVRTIMSALVLIFAGLKARIILARYLGLGRSRFWMAGFDGAIGFFLILAFAIYAFSTSD